MDLNSDVGESFGAYTIGDDEALLDLVTSASVACGFHAGDPVVMTRTVRAAVARGVVVGAHVGYRDLQGFGRRVLDLPPAELTADIVYQIGALQAVAGSVGGRVRYVKAHGALYNSAAADPVVARALVEAVRSVDPSMPILTLPDSAVVTIASELGVTTISECFADRAYTASGALVPRSQPGAVIHAAELVATRAVTLARDGGVAAIDGSWVPVRAESLCVHGDTPGASVLARAIRQALAEAGVVVAAFT